MSDGIIEHAQAIAEHASPRMTKLNYRRGDAISIDKIGRIGICGTDNRLRVIIWGGTLSLGVIAQGTLTS